LRCIAKLAALIAALSLSGATGASAATLDFVGNFDQPIYVTSDPDDPDHLFVVEREGRVMVADESGVTLFGELESLVTCCTSERGLLSIALAPDFATSERFYAAYTGTVAAGGTVGDIHIDAFHPGPGNGELLREQIIHIDHDKHPNHHGGQLHFGPDGYLYISVGDGGGAGDPEKEAQKLETPNGKVLRIDPEPEEDPPYTTPADNPFVGTVGADERIWSYGLRNPWRFSFDRDTGDMVVADVGQGKREEIDFAPSPGAGLVGGEGANYGWACREGLIAYEVPPEYCVGLDPSIFTNPVFDYPHDDPGGDAAHGCSITGGYVVRDPGVIDLFGRYVYADFCAGEIRSLALPGAGGGPATGDRSEHLEVDKPVSFGEDSSGRVYVVSQAGQIYRLAPGDATGPQDPMPPKQSPPTGPAPTKAPRIRIEAKRRGGADSSLFRVTVRAQPCAGLGGVLVRLNRGGRPSGAKPLSPGCVAHFHRRVTSRSTFRALLLSAGGVLRSPRLVVDGSG